MFEDILMDKSLRDKLFMDLVEKTNLESCPFFTDWWGTRVKEAVPSGKKVLMLYKLAYPKVSLKKFAQAYGLSYGTVRNWCSGDEFYATQDKLADEFMGLFLEKLRKLIESRTDTSDQIYQHVRETEFYESDDINWIMPMRIYKLQIKDEFIDNKLGAVYLYRRARLNKTDSENPTRHKDLNKEMFEHDNEILKIYFDSLIKHIKKGDHKFALKLAEFLKGWVTEKTMPQMIDFTMLLYKRIEEKGKWRIKKDG